MIKNNGYTSKYIGGYHISLELASSSSSRVFLGESISPDRQNVAIKRVYIINITSHQDEESFLQEATMLKQLHHPYILPLLSAYVLKGTPYIVSEYAPDGDLRNRLQRNGPAPLPQDEALALLSQVGQALYYVHQKNIIHGNVKPQNILFNRKGDALLADFKFTSLSSLTDDFTGTSLLESVYTSPEQIEGVISQANDQYSLSCIAYEMFTGRKPFTIPSIKQPGTSYKTRTLIAPTKLNPALPPHIEQAILKAMAKEPSQRYKNVLEFIEALNTLPTLIVPNDPLLKIIGRSSALASQQRDYSLPQFPGLKVAPTGATTLAQFTSRAALLRNTFTPGFSTSPLTNGSPIVPLFSPGKRKMLQPLLIITSLLLITTLIAGIAFAFSPLHMQRANQASTAPGSTTPSATHHQKGTPDNAKPGTQSSKTAGGIIVPAQPTQASRPTPQSSPTTTTSSTTMFSVTPTILNNGNCAHNNDYSICTVTLSLGTAAHHHQHWYTYTIGIGANFSPSSGTISPGQTIAIRITVFDTCTKTGTFVFVGSKTNVTATWNC